MSVSDWIQVGICIVAFAGIFINIYSIHKQTKYKLFKDRLDLYVDIKDYIEKYEETILPINLKGADLEFVNGIKNKSGNIILENTVGHNSWAMEDNLKITGEIIEEIIFNRLNDMKANSVKCELLFKKCEIETLQDFIDQYREFLYLIFNFKLFSEKHSSLDSPGKHLSLTSKAKKLKRTYRKIKKMKELEYMYEEISLRGSFILRLRRWFKRAY